MRKSVLLIGVLAGTLVVASPAYAIQSIQKASAKVSPSKAGTKAKPRAISLTVRSYFDSIAPDLDQEVQFATVNGKIFFPKEGLTNNKLFPGCNQNTIFNNENKCPAGSKVGTGTARGIGLGLDEAVKLTVFNLPAGKGVAVLVVGDSPLIIRDVVVANLTTLSNDPLFKYELSFSIPKDLQSPAPGVIAAVKDLSITIPRQYLKKKGKYVLKKKQKVPYIATTGCATGSWKGRYIADYTTSFDGTIESSQTADVSVPCTK